MLTNILPFKINFHYQIKTIYQQLYFHIILHLDSIIIMPFMIINNYIILIQMLMHHFKIINNHLN